MPDDAGTGRSSRSPHRQSDGKGDGKGDPAPLTKEEIDKQIKSSMGCMEAKLTSSITASVSAGLGNTISEQVAGAVSGLQLLNETRFSNIEGQLNGVKLEQQEQRGVLEDLRNETKEIRQLLTRPTQNPQSQSSTPNFPVPDFTEAVSQPASSGNNFFRVPNPTILYISTFEAKDVAKEKVAKAFGDLTADANINDADYQLHGDPIGNKFEVDFTGTISAAKAKATQLLQSLRLGPGSYKEICVDSPGGTQTRIFVNPDKNGAMVKREILSKLLAKELGEIKPEKQFFARRSEGIIFVDRRPIVQINVTGPESATLLWKHTKRINIGLDQEGVETRFKEILEQGGGEPWS